MIRRGASRSRACSGGTSGDSRCCSDDALRKKIRLIAGVTVSATTIEASSASAYDRRADGRTSRTAPEQEDRHDRDDLDQGRVDDRAAHLERGLEDDPRRSTSHCPAFAALAQPPNDVLDVDDGVVDDVAEGDHEPGQDHRVDRGPARVQHEARRDQATAGSPRR